MLEQFTQELIQWIQTLPPLSIYAVFFLVAYLENIIPPVPGDVLVAFGGYLAAESIIELLPVYVLTTVASVIGFMTMYWLGSHWGIQIEKQKAILADEVYPPKIYEQGSQVDGQMGARRGNGQPFSRGYPVGDFIDCRHQSHGNSRYQSELYNQFPVMEWNFARLRLGRARELADYWKLSFHLWTRYPGDHNWFYYHKASDVPLSQEKCNKQ